MLVIACPRSQVSFYRQRVRRVGGRLESVGRFCHTFRSWLRVRGKSDYRSLS